MISVFLSHNNKDKPFVRRLGVQLAENGVKAWVDEAEILVGDSLLMKIESAIKECDYLGVVLSPNSVSSEWVRKEVNLAMHEEIDGKKVKVLPILYKKCEIPGFLKDKLYADFSDDYDSGFAKLISRLRKDLNAGNDKRRFVKEAIHNSFSDWQNFNYFNEYLLNAHKITLLTSCQTDMSFNNELIRFMLLSFSKELSRSSSLLMKIEQFINSTYVKHDFIRTLKDIITESNNIEFGLLVLGLKFSDKEIDHILIDKISIEKDVQIKQMILKHLLERKIEIKREILTPILGRESDWVVRSYLLGLLGVKNNCLFFSDSTNFSQQLHELFSSLGYDITYCKVESFPNEDDIDATILAAYDLIVLIKGEHFMQTGNENFYLRLHDFVSHGGMLFSTPWVSWENKYNYEFRKLLPFKHVQDLFEENVLVNCLSINSDEKHVFKIKTSYEILRSKPDSVVLLKTLNDIPILGYKKFYDGVSIYLNSCQHTCRGQMDSPFEYEPTFYDFVKSSIIRIIKEQNKSSMPML